VYGFYEKSYQFVHGFMTKMVRFCDKNSPPGNVKKAKPAMGSKKMEKLF